MKTKILLLALFGLFFGAKTYAQLPLCVTMYTTVTCPVLVCAQMDMDPACNGGTCGYLAQPNCCQTIPAGVNPQTCFNGSEGCPTLYWAPNITGPCNLCASYRVVISSTCSGSYIQDTYTIHWITSGGLGSWEFSWDNSTGDTYTTAGGIKNADFILESTGNGTMGIYLYQGGGGTDDQNQHIGV